MLVILIICSSRGEAARQQAAESAEAAAQQQAVVAAVEAESKHEIVTEPSAVSQVIAPFSYSIPFDKRILFPIYLSLSLCFISSLISINTRNVLLAFWLETSTI